MPSRKGRVGWCLLGDGRESGWDVDVRCEEGVMRFVFRLDSCLLESLGMDRNNLRIGSSSVCKT